MLSIFISSCTLRQTQSFAALTPTLFFSLQTLGHLEKAVVLELTLKHVKALTSLIEQQQQQIIALQKGLHAGEYFPPIILKGSIGDCSDLISGTCILNY